MWHKKNRNDKPSLKIKKKKRKNKELQEKKDAGTQLKATLESVQMGIGLQNMDA